MYGKTWAAIASAALVALISALGGDGNVEADEWVQIAIAAVTAISVYLVPITPTYRWMKSAVAVLLTVLQALATALLGGRESNDWVTVAVAGLGALAVILAPATSINPAGNGNVSVPLGSDR